jgi:6-phosphogluconolactonase (cycloisomerase 2 family)
MHSTFTRRNAVRLLAVVAAVGSLAAPAWAHDDDDGRDGMRQGKLFTITNAPAGNEVLVYNRNATGPATLAARVATHGAGTGAGLGSQGAVTLSGNGRYLFVVNAASNTISTFTVGRDGLSLSSVVDSGGLRPTSVAENDGLVYVLNADGAGNVAGYRNVRGVLTPIAGSSRGLSAAGGTAPAQVSFDTDGDSLVVSERNTNLLTSYRVRRDGTLDSKASTATPGRVPFGFAVSKRNVLVLSEAASGSVSSFRFPEHGTSAPQVVTSALATTQGAPCWVAITPDGRIAYSANAGSSSVSSFAIGRDGSLSLLSAQAGLTGANAGAIDMAVSPDGSQLAVFASRGLQIVSFKIARDGSLSPLGSVGGMPAGSAGLAAN